MKKIILLLVLIFGATAVFAELENVGNGFSILDIKRQGKILSYKFKVDDIATLNAMIQQQVKGITIDSQSVSYITGEIVCDCSNYKYKSNNISFFGQNGSPLANYKDDTWRADKNEQMRFLCESTK